MLQKYLLLTEPVTSISLVVDSIEPVSANIPSCPSIPLAGTPVKPAPLPTKEPLKVEPLIRHHHLCAVAEPVIKSNEQKKIL